YSLEVGYVGDGPSPVGTWEFQVGSGGTVLSWGWLLGLAAAGGLIVPAIRHVPWFARARFRIEKALFAMRRRNRYRTQQPEPADLSDSSGQVLRARYRLRRLVSPGGFSAVYEAEDLNDPAARLAVKVLIRSPGQESWVRDRFAHEVAALRSVDHPCV